MKFVIGSRPDLLGGKLIVMLNALRLSRRLGARFLHTWEIQRADVLAPPDLYSDATFAAAYLPERETGAVVDQTFVRRLRTTDRTQVLESNGRETTAVRVDPSDFDSFDAFICTERFALYLLPGETVDDVRREIADLAATLPLAAAIRESADRLRRMIGAGATGIHVRRMDLTGFRQRYESMLSYVPDGYIDALVLDSPADRKFVVCGDDPQIGRRVERLRPGGVIRPAKLLADAPLDSRQKAFVDLLSLAACDRIHAGRSAFSSVAALMGNATLLDFRHDAQTANRPPAADPLTASFFFFDRGGRALAEGDAAAACAAFEMATAFDPQNFCCQLDQVRGWALAGDRRFETGAAHAVTRFVAANERWTDGVSSMLNTLGLAASVKADPRHGALNALEAVAARVQNREPFDDAGMTIAPARFGDADSPFARALGLLQAWMQSCCHEINQDVTRATTTLTRASLGREQLAAFALRLTWLAMARGDLAEAAIYAGNGLLWNERNARLEFYLSMVEDKRGDFPAASRAARRALAIDPSDAGLWHHCGNMASRNGLFDEAVAFYRGAIALSPLNGVFWARMCPVLAHLGRFEDLREGLTWLIEARFREPGNVANIERHLGQRECPADIRAALDGLRVIEATAASTARA